MYPSSRIFKGIRYVAKHPQDAYFFVRYAKNDLYSSLGLYKYSNNIIYIAGLPKSGSTWLYNMMLEIPGFNRRFYKGPVLLDTDGKFMNTWDDISDETFNSAPRKGYSVIKEHTRYNDKNWGIISRYMNRMVVLIRDPRDVCVSLYFHHKNDENHHFYKIFQSLSESEGIDYAANIIKEEYIPWILGWKEAVTFHKGRILEVRYENLWTDTSSELQRVLDFYNIKVSQSCFEKMLNAKISEEQNFKKNLNNAGKRLKFSTARKGGSGGWKSYFSDKQKNEFKDDAGKLLIDLGYEKDFNW